MGLTEIINFFLVTGERAAWNGSLHRNHRVSEIVQLILTRPRHGVYVIIERDAKRFTDDVRANVWKITDSNQQRKLESSRLYTSSSKTTSTIKEKRKKKKKKNSIFYKVRDYSYRVFSRRVTRLYQTQCMLNNYISNYRYVTQYERLDPS